MNVIRRVIFFATVFTVIAVSNLSAQIFAIKTNAPAWLTFTPNVGIEAVIAPKVSINADVMVNALGALSEKYDFYVGIVSPGVRYWFKDAFAGSFVGANLSVGAADITWKSKRYQGVAYGGGLSYGYAWVMSKRWNLEGELGLGLYNATYRTNEGPTGLYGSFKNKMFVAPSKLAVNMVYLF